MRYPPKQLHKLYPNKTKQTPKINCRILTTDEDIKNKYKQKVNEVIENLKIHITIIKRDGITLLKRV